MTTGANVITREELYELVWSAPMIKVAEKFDVSGSYLARVCAALRVPRPERGYWAKLAVGKAPERPALPEPPPGDPTMWSRTDEFPAPSAPKPRLTPRSRVPRPARAVTGTHGLIRGAKEHFLASRKVDEGEHLKPYKKLLVDVTASRSGLDKALGLANDLFNALEFAGHRVVIAPPDAQFRRDHIIEKLQEADRQAENRRLERLAEEERRRQEEDRRRVAQSEKDSCDQLEQVIQSWSKVVSLEQFFQGVEDRAQTLPEAERQAALERLRLAREFVGTQDPLDFFRGWKTPLERYVPLLQRPPRSHTADDEDAGES